MDSSTKATPGIDPKRCRLAGDLERLHHVPLFKGITSDVVRMFAYLSERKNFRDGDYLITQDQQAQHAFLIVNGAVHISVNHREKEVLLQKLGDGVLFGELALLANFKWFFNAVCVGDVDVLAISRMSFQKICEKYPDQKDTLIERLIQLRVDRLVSQTDFMLDQLLYKDVKGAAALI
jgi:CRP-like cAMP-binding protein